MLTHSPECLNIDHKIVYNATMTAFRGMKKFNPIKIMCYEVPSSSEWNPVKNFRSNFYIDITNFYDKKIKALKIYESEMRNYPHPRSFKNIDATTITVGSEVGFERAEKFMIVRESL